MESMAVPTLAGSRPAETFTGEFLIPAARRSVGFVHAQVKTWKFKKWFMDDLVTKAARPQPVAPAQQYPSQA